MLLDVCDDVKECFPTLDLTEYVDDLTLGHAGKDWFNTDVLAAATDHVIETLEKGLGLEVSATKSVVTASSEKQALDISAKITSKKIEPHTHAKMLGASTCSARRRCTYQLRTRLNGTRAKSGRVRRLRRSGVNTALWTATAGIPAMMYTADITGVADSMLTKQGFLAARTVISILARHRIGLTRTGDTVREDCRIVPVDGRSHQRLHDLVNLRMRVYSVQ